MGDHGWEGAEYLVRVESSLSDSKAGELEKEEEGTLERDLSLGRLLSSPCRARPPAKLLKRLMEDPDVLV